MSAERADRFWPSVLDAVEGGERRLLVAVGPDEQLHGTVQLVRAPADNQPHRGDVAKMLVHRRARRRGIAQLLLHAVEMAARDDGLTLLVLDTVTGSDAERLYARAGWTRVGEVPGYALMPDGQLTPTTVFYKSLAAP